MKKTAYLALALTMCLFLTGCCLSHEWADASCTAPKTCIKCEETEGEALGHEWNDATCTAPRTCAKCEETEGSALGHNVVDTICTRCTLTEEEIFFIGEWQCYKISISDNSTFPNGNYDAEDFRFALNSDGTCTLYFQDELHEGKWSIDDDFSRFINFTYNQLFGPNPRYVCDIEFTTIEYHFSVVSAIDFGAKEDIEMSQNGFTAFFSKVVPTQDSSNMSGCSDQHEWGNWEADSNDMKRSCFNCSETEIKPLDWDMLVDQFFIGNWHAISIREAETHIELFTPDEREFKETQCVFSADHTCSVNLLGNPAVGTWKAVPRSEEFPNTFGIIVELDNYAGGIVFYTSAPDTGKFVMEIPGNESRYQIFWGRTNN